MHCEKLPAIKHGFTHHIAVEFTEISQENGDLIARHIMVKQMAVGTR